MEHIAAEKYKTLKELDCKTWSALVRASKHSFIYVWGTICSLWRSWCYGWREIEILPLWEVGFAELSSRNGPSLYCHYETRSTRQNVIRWVWDSEKLKNKIVFLICPCTFHLDFLLPLVRARESKKEKAGANDEENFVFHFLWVSNSSNGIFAGWSCFIMAIQWG